MVKTSNNKLTNLFVIAALSMSALVACTDNADKTGDRNPVVTGDSSAVADSTSGYGSKDAAGTKSMAKKKGKASVAMSSSGAAREKAVKDNEGVYKNPTVMPEFPGGQNGLETYVNNRVQYPEQAIEDNTAGVVRVSFVVDEHGKVMNAKIIGGQKVGDGLDEEALRVVNNMPAWKPGKVKGRNVKTRLELPINFQLEA
jgi:TonB family protein